MTELQGWIVIGIMGTVVIWRVLNYFTNNKFGLDLYRLVKKKLRLL